MNFSHISLRLSSKSSHFVIEVSRSSFCLRFSSSIFSFSARISDSFFAISMYFCSKSCLFLLALEISVRMFCESLSLYNHSERKVTGFLGRILFSSESPRATVRLYESKYSEFGFLGFSVGFFYYFFMMFF